MTEGKQPPSSFPVVFHDGKNDIRVGDIEIQPSMDVKTLQSILCSKIGIAPYQASYMIICRKNTKSVRRIPIKESLDFYGILEQEENCCFLVSLKTSSSRRSGTRRGGSGRNPQEEEEDLTSLQKRFMTHPPQVLLRRDSTTPYYNPVSSSPLGFPDYYTNQLQIQKENYVMAMMNSYPSFEYGYGRESAAGGGGGGLPVCDVCLQASGRPVPFHWCVYDRTTVGFRSPAGPIQRPSSKGRD